MSRTEEIITEIDGKIAYADSTGNMEAKHELCEIRAVLENYNHHKRDTLKILGVIKNEV